MSFTIWDRKRQASFEEQSYPSATLIKKFYGRGLFYALLRAISCTHWFARLYGLLQRTKRSARKIPGFIAAHHIDTSEFADSPSSYQSFNDFFIRKLRPECRPICAGKTEVAAPADARYTFFEKIPADLQVLVKGQNFTLEELLQNKELASRYVGGNLVFARLCPSDYHRFHFPVDGTIHDYQVIPGKLFAVNPAALLSGRKIFPRNARTINRIMSPQFGEVTMLEIGATNVGSIRQTAKTGCFYKKGTEKGYFEFGGSALILLFEVGMMELDADLRRNTEILIRQGERIGIKKEVTEKY